MLRYGAAANSTWVRPPAWLNMPSDASNQIAILAAVWDTGSNYCAFTCSVSSGTYDVDWGDGTTSTGVSSGSAAEHQYDYADANLNGTLTSGGYKQAIIIVTPNTGGANFTALTFGILHSRAGLVSTFSNPWLDVLVNAPSATSLSFGGGTTCVHMQRCIISAIGNLTSASAMFYQAKSLQVVDFPAGFGANVTDSSSMFSGCEAIQTISLPDGFGESVTNMGSMFQNCSALRSITLPAGFGSIATAASYMFYDNVALKELSLPAGFGANITDATGMLSYCGVETLTLPSGFGADITNATTMFGYSRKLRVLNLPTGAFASLVTSTTMFAGLPNLSRITNCEIPVSFSVQDCSLAGTELDEIYTSLPSVSATITITGNHGAADDDPSIATGKGWTVTV